MQLILLMIIKIIDNILATTKTILTQKGKAALAAITVAFSQFIFFTIVSQIVASDENIKTILVSISSGIGTYLAIKLSDKFSKDKIFVNTILSDDKEAMTQLCEYLREHKIKNLVTDSYTKNWNKTLAVTVFAETKEHSRLVDEFIEKSEKKYLRIVK